jgi:hypothetical protein
MSLSTYYPAGMGELSVGGFAIVRAVRNSGCEYAPSPDHCEGKRVVSERETVYLSAAVGLWGTLRRRTRCRATSSCRRWSAWVSSWTHGRATPRARGAGTCRRGGCGHPGHRETSRAKEEPWTHPPPRSVCVNIVVDDSHLASTVLWYRSFLACESLGVQSVKGDQTFSTGLGVLLGSDREQGRCWRAPYRYDDASAAREPPVARNNLVWWSTSTRKHNTQGISEQPATQHTRRPGRFNFQRRLAGNTLERDGRAGALAMQQGLAGPGA